MAGLNQPSPIVRKRTCIGRSTDISAYFANLTFMLQLISSRGQPVRQTQIRVLPDLVAKVGSPTPRSSKRPEKRRGTPSCMEGLPKCSGLTRRPAVG